MSAASVDMYIFSHDYTFFINPIRVKEVDKIVLSNNIGAIIVRLDSPLFINSYKGEQNDSISRIEKLILWSRHLGYDILDIKEYPFYCNAFIIDKGCNIKKDDIAVRISFTCELYQDFTNTVLSPRENKQERFSLNEIIGKLKKIFN